MTKEQKNETSSAEKQLVVKDSFFKRNIISPLRKIVGDRGIEMLGLASTAASIGVCALIAAPTIGFIAPILGLVYAGSKMAVTFFPKDDPSIPDEKKSFAQKTMRNIKKFLDRPIVNFIGSVAIGATAIAIAVLTGGIATIAIPAVVFAAGVVKSTMQYARNYFRIKKFLEQKEKLEKSHEPNSKLTKAVEKKKTNSKFKAFKDALYIATSTMLTVVRLVCSALCFDVVDATSCMTDFRDIFTKDASKAALEESVAESIEKLIERKRDINPQLLVHSKQDEEGHANSEWQALKHAVTLTPEELEKKYDVRKLLEHHEKLLMPVTDANKDAVKSPIQTPQVRHGQGEKFQR